MGHMHATEFAGALDGSVSLEAAIGWHLRSNHYPPHPAFMVPVALAAIEAVNEGDYDRVIDLPDEVVFQDGRTSVEARLIVDSLHLGAFIGWAGED